MVCAGIEAKEASSKDIAAVDLGLPLVATAANPAYSYWSVAYLYFLSNFATAELCPQRLASGSLSVWSQDYSAYSEVYLAGLQAIFRTVEVCLQVESEMHRPAFQVF